MAIEKEVLQQAQEYRDTLKSLVSETPTLAERKSLIRSERKTLDYHGSKRIIRENREAEWKARKHLSVSSEEVMLSEEAEASQLADNVAEGGLQDSIILGSETDPQERVRKWAYNTLKHYEEMPRGNSNERRRSDKFIEETTRHLLVKPEDIDPVGNIWQAYTKEGAEDSLYQRVVRSAVSEAKEGWKKMTPAHLGEYIKVYSHSSLNKELAAQILRGYFKGPSNATESTDGLYNLAFAALDLVDDPQALHNAVGIGLFMTDIVSRDSSFQLGWYQSRFLTIDNDDLLRRAFNAESILFSMLPLTNWDEDAVRKSNIEYEYSSDKLMDFVGKRVRELEKRYDKERVKQIINVLSDSGSVPQLMLESKEMEKLMSRWPYSLTYDISDPLRRKYQEEVGPLITSLILRRGLISDYKRRGVNEDIVFVDIPINDGFSIGMGLPVSLVPKKNEILRSVLQSGGFSEEEKVSLEDKALNRTGLAFHRVDDIAVGIWYRPLSGIEARRHEISALEEFGFPTPQAPEGQTLDEATELLRDKVERTQTRYLIERGIKKPLHAQELRNLGYTDISFYKDRGQPGARVKVGVAGQTYSVRLDERFNFDFEGKSFSSPQLHTNLKYVALSILEQILCEKNEDNGHEAETEETRQIVSRMGHLRLLPQGKTRTLQAVMNYREYEGLDLVVKNEIRKRELNTARETTYVKPVIREEGEELPPMVMDIPENFEFSEAA